MRLSNECRCPKEMRKLSVSKSSPWGPLNVFLIDIKSGASYNSISVVGMVTVRPVGQFMCGHADAGDRWAPRWPPTGRCRVATVTRVESPPCRLRSPQANIANIYHARHLNHSQTYLSYILVVCKFNTPQYKGFSGRITATFSDIRRTSYQCD